MHQSARPRIKAPTPVRYRLLTQILSLVTVFLVLLSGSHASASGQTESVPGQPQRIEIRLAQSGNHPAVEVRGFDPPPGFSDWQNVLRVYVIVEGAESEVPAILGSYQFEPERLLFRPRFPLTPGLRIRVTFDPGAMGFDRSAEEPAVIHILEVPRPVTEPSTAVAQVYPSGQELPANLLKFYVHFSASMSRGLAYSHISLLDQRGEKVSLPFLELDEELWDDRFQRLTLLFDPGRIKRGLLPREQVGPALLEGREYTLLIHRGWLDAGGERLVGDFRKHFRVGLPDREPPDPQTWQIDAPAGKTRAALELHFPEPLDHALLRRLVWVVDSTGTRVAGEVSTGREETAWFFQPRTEWQPGDYSIEVGLVLEDLAGNAIGQPFEVDVFERVRQQVARSTVRLPFVIH